MKTAKVVDGGRQRCTDCGHPRREHRSDKCTVPKCDCVRYAQVEAKG